MARDLAEGGRVLRGQPVARALLLVTVIFLAANASLSAMLIPLGIRRLGGGENTGFVLSALGVGFLLAAPLLRALLDRVQPRTLLTATLAATAAGQFGLFTSTSLATALPAAVAIGMFGSMSEVIPQTAMQRVIPNAVLGRISAVFLTGEAAVGLVGAVAGPFLAQAVHLAGLATVASLVTLAAAALTRLSVPRMPVIVPGTGTDRDRRDRNAGTGTTSVPLARAGGRSGGRAPFTARGSPMAAGLSHSRKDLARAAPTVMLRLETTAGGPSWSWSGRPWPAHRPPARTGAGPALRPGAIRRAAARRRAA